MSDRELTYEEFCNLPMGYGVGIHCSRYAMRMYRNAEHGVQTELYTPKDKHGRWGEGRWYYFLDGDVREFANSAEQYVAYMERVCGVKHD